MLALGVQDHCCRSLSGSMHTQSRGQSHPRQEEVLGEGSGTDTNKLIAEFNFDDTIFKQFFEKQRMINRKMRWEKRHERLRVLFANSTQELNNEVRLDRKGVLAEQKVINTLQNSWMDAEGKESLSYVVCDDLLYHGYEKGGDERKLQLVISKK